MLNDIEVFVKVVECGSFTDAAERLAVSKSVVSKYVTRLESVLNARLLNRTTRRLSLTEVGRAFYERSAQSLREIDDAVQDVSRMSGNPAGLLKLNTPMSFGILHVAPHLPEFMQRYPEITVEMNLDDRKVDIIEPGFDVSIRIADLPDASFVARRLGPCRHHIVASADYIDREGRPSVPKDLAKHNVLTYQHQASRAEWHFQSLQGDVSSVSVGGRLQVNNSLALRAAVLGGLGVARMPSFAIASDIRDGRLIQLLPGYNTLELSIYAIYPERRHLSPKARVFVDFMASKITDNPNWELG
ncbi:LysR family transcriptional regulator [Motiliproteus sediminis]|uniref:LysR family transcriptional regulator n=1 Tax=Motiliproteus sediminis TaxID=1468178 RepID=UPI001AEF93EB|nr:LysR family transcriptional regulator [Motiliproteus sediminis]